jgi:quercetin dioxygenase-like cupin family protein
MNPPLVMPGGGRKVAIAGDVYQIKLIGAETGGRYALCEFFVPPGGGPPPHIHTREDEAFYVLGGELTFTVAGTEFVVPAGGFLNAPRGVAHRFTNACDKPARAIVIASPAGLEDFFLEIGQPWDEAYRAPGPPTPEQIAKLLATAPKYGIEILPPPH